jgi:serine phosphatase RsbU (regulator of sigma subunit)
VPPGGRLLLYTDGVTETMTLMDEPFGPERLQAFLLKHCRESAADIIHTLTVILEKFRGDTDQQDDVTALAIARKGS